jgi:hypothetical protein
MGNRAVITFDKKVGIYLHWNGGLDSVGAFLKYCELRGFRFDDYGLARLVQIISNFFGGDLSIGVGPYNELDTDNGDNGVYVVKDWKIVERLFYEGEEQNEYELPIMLKSIDMCQREDDQLWKDKDKLTEEDYTH